MRGNHAPDRVRWHEYCATHFGAVLHCGGPHTPSAPAARQTRSRSPVSALGDRPVRRPRTLTARVGQLADNLLRQGDEAAHHTITSGSPAACRSQRRGRLSPILRSAGARLHCARALRPTGRRCAAPSGPCHQSCTATRRRPRRGLQPRRHPRPVDTYALEVLDEAYSGEHRHCRGPAAGNLTADAAHLGSGRRPPSMRAMQSIAQDDHDGARPGTRKPIGPRWH